MFLREVAMFKDFGRQHPTQYFYYWQFFMKRIVYIILVVFSENFQQMGLAVMTMLCAFTMLWTVYTLPFDTRMRNLGAIINEAALFGLFCVSFTFLSGASSLEYTHFAKYGAVFGFFVFAFIVANAPLVLFETLAYRSKIG